MSRAERAKELFTQGYACSQAVVLAFADLTGLDEVTLKRMALPFGGGLGRLRLTCGAISGMALVIGLVLTKDEDSAENKMRTYAIVQELCQKFKDKNGSLVCGELLKGASVQTTVGGVAEARTEAYYKKRPCGELVYDCAEILDEYLKEKGVL